MTDIASAPQQNNARQADRQFHSHIVWKRSGLWWQKTEVIQLSGHPIRARRVVGSARRWWSGGRQRELGQPLACLFWCLFVLIVRLDVCLALHFRPLHLMLLPCIQKQSRRDAIEHADKPDLTRPFPSPVATVASALHERLAAR